MERHSIEKIKCSKLLFVTTSTVLKNKITAQKYKNLQVIKTTFNRTYFPLFHVFCNHEVALNSASLTY